MEKTEQMNFWEGDFGDEYTDRNSGDFEDMYKKQFGITRTELNKEFLGDIAKDAKILEVGCNRGIQLKILDEMGFENLWGVEINKSALKIAKEVNSNFNLVLSSGFDIPFKDSFFDVTFTSGVLIHIHPDDLKCVIDEMYRTSKRYIWGFEYFSPECTEIEYRGHKNRLWKNNFMQLFLDRHPDLKVVKEKKVKYLGSENEDVMFLLEKTT